jgi:hypothetical protein
MTMLAFFAGVAVGWVSYWYAGDKIASVFATAKGWVDAWKAKP